MDDKTIQNLKEIWKRIRKMEKRIKELEIRHNNFVNNLKMEDY